MTTEASNLWKVSHFFHMGGVTYIHTIRLPRLFYFFSLWFFKSMCMFPSNCIIKQITSTHYFFGIFHMKYDLILHWKKLSHSEIDCFAIHLVNALYPSLISWLFKCIFEHIMRFISGLKHKTYFVSITIIVLRIKWNQIQVCFIPVFKWAGLLRVMVEKKKRERELASAKICPCAGYGVSERAKL